MNLNSIPAVAAFYKRVDSLLQKVDRWIYDWKKSFRFTGFDWESRSHEAIANSTAPGATDCREQAVRYAFRAHDQVRAKALIERYVSEVDADPRLVQLLSSMK